MIKFMKINFIGKCSHVKVSIMWNIFFMLKFVSKYINYNLNVKLSFEKIFIDIIILQTISTLFNQSLSSKVQKLNFVY